MKNRLKCWRDFHAGNEESFSKIFSRFRKPILKYVSSRVYDRESAEEVTQEVFLKVYRFRANYRPEFAFSTWLWTIARNTVSDFLRKGIITSEMILDPEEIPSNLQDAEAFFSSRRERKYLLLSMRSLTRLQKRVLWMRVVHGLSYPEISRSMGLSLSSVKNLAHRARHAIQSTISSPEGRCS